MAKKTQVVPLTCFIVMGCFAARIGAAETAVPDSAPPPKSAVLYDFREYADEKPNLAPGEEARLFSRLFPKYLNPSQRCDESLEFAPSEEDVKSGQFRPAVHSVARGAFTKPGWQETAYLIGMWECHVGRFGTFRLVVLAGDNIALNQEVPARLIRRVTDLDGDGIQELLLEGGGTGTGVTETNARLVKLTQGRIQVLKDFHEVAVDSCASGRPEDSITASVILYRSKGHGVLPDFQALPYSAKCPPEGEKPRFRATPRKLE